jgi:hypothetical protein
MTVYNTRVRGERALANFNVVPMWGLLTMAI